MDRRQLIGWGLASLATGLAPRCLVHGLPEGRAQGLRFPTPLILATSQQGDALNVHAPGGPLPPVPDAAFSPAPVAFGGSSFDAAGVWRDLPSALRDRMAFAHHRTGAVAHSEYDRVMALSGAVRRRSGPGPESLTSAMAQELAAPLGTLQPSPIPLGPEGVAFDGAPLARVEPSAVVALFGADPSPLQALHHLRDRVLDDVYAELNESGTPSQRAFLDEVATSREQARALGDRLFDMLHDFEPGSDQDGPRDQIVVAVALAALRVAPVITIHVPFGGDNHRDPGLVAELTETRAGLAHLSDLWARLRDLAIEDQVTIGMLNVFGRRPEGTDGRDHHPDHNVLWMAGPHVRGGVAGHVDAEGAADETVTLARAGATLAAAVGLDDDRLHARIPDVPPIPSLLRR